MATLQEKVFTTNDTALSADSAKESVSTSPSLLEVKGIKKKFGFTKVLKGIDFSLKKGEVLAIIGSSGSGKTTLLRCLNFLEFADEGTISVNGEVLYDGKEEATAKKKLRNNDGLLRKKRLHFGLVFQNFNLFPHKSVIANLTLAPTLQFKKEIRAAKRAENAAKRALKKALDPETIAKIKADLETKKTHDYASLEEIRFKALDTLERVGLLDKKDNYPCELSGGQQQRVAIARALVMNPDILCFDEPTSALDPELTGEVLKVIRELKNSDTTMIVVTHEMEFARDVADKVIYMANGVIEEAGTPEAVFGNPQSEKTKAFLSSRKQ